jgi:hypothetical protein
VACLLGEGEAQECGDDKGPHDGGLGVQKDVCDLGNFVAEGA